MEAVQLYGRRSSRGIECREKRGKREKESGLAVSEPNKERSGSEVGWQRNRLVI